MTDEQQKKIANNLITEIQKKLLEAARAESGKEKLGKLKKISRLIEKEAAIHQLPSEWIKFFGPAGLESDLTYLVCGFMRPHWLDDKKLELCPGTRHVFKTREKHGAMEEKRQRE